MNYLVQGGSLYIEGANIGTNHHNTDFWNYLGAGFNSPGYEFAIAALQGNETSPFAGLQYNYSGGIAANYMIDELAIGNAEIYLTSQDDAVRGTYYDGGNYRVVVQSPILGAIQDGSGDNTKAHLMHLIVEYLSGSTPAIDPTVVPAVAELIGNYPNPFNPSTRIDFLLPASCQQAALTIYNIKGQKVNDYQIDPGMTSITWYGTDEQGMAVASGMYMYVLETDKKVTSKKMLLLK